MLVAVQSGFLGVDIAIGLPSLAVLARHMAMCQKGGAVFLFSV